MTEKLICIICPSGCDIVAELDEAGVVVSVEGAVCKRGEEYARVELTDPRRNIASSVLIENGELPLASVRLTEPVPLALLFPVMEEIKRIRLKAPVRQGQVVIKDVLGLESDVIITKNVKEVG